MKAWRSGLREDGDTYVLRYQFDCLLWRNDIVSVLRGDGPPNVPRP